MGAFYTVNGYLSLDTAREAEYRPILAQLREDLWPEEYGYDPATGNFWIESWADRSGGSIERIEEILIELGKYALQATKMLTKYDDDVHDLWVGPSQRAILLAKIADVQEEISYLTKRLAALKEEELCLR
mgnify:CR=1 FL=1